MNNLKPLLILLLLISFSACRQDQYEVNVIDAEGWTDLMPNAGGKTFVHLQLSINGKVQDELNISGLAIKHGDDHYQLSDSEFSYKVEYDENPLLVEIKADFQLRPNGEETIDSEIEYSVNGYAGKIIIDDIHIEKVN